MQIRRYKKSDIAAIARLYYQTVHFINSRDYPEEQISAWAPRIYEDSFWRIRFKKHQVYVAEQDGIITGFAKFENTGHIDCFYVHHEWQGRGVGTQLMAHIESAARRRKIHRLFADVSITAMSFFRKMGFRIVRRQKRIYRGCSFKQFYLEKRSG
jgi:putative acetyltransferase